MSAADVRSELKTVLETVAGFHVYAYPTSQPEMPCMVIQAPTVRPQEGTIGGAREQDWQVSVLFPSGNVADSISKFDALVDGALVSALEGASSAWHALQVNYIGNVGLEGDALTAEIDLTILAKA